MLQPVAQGRQRTPSSAESSKLSAAYEGDPSWLPHVEHVLSANIDTSNKNNRNAAVCWSVFLLSIESFDLYNILILAAAYRLLQLFCCCSALLADYRQPIDLCQKTLGCGRLTSVLTS